MKRVDLPKVILGKMYFRAKRERKILICTKSKFGVIFDLHQIFRSREARAKILNIKKNRRGGGGGATLRGGGVIPGGRIRAAAAA